jgi:Undecaprenyl-phosphate glucose phosphotransferase
MESEPDSQHARRPAAEVAAAITFRGQTKQTLTRYCSAQTQDVPVLISRAPVMSPRVFAGLVRLGEFAVLALLGWLISPLRGAGVYGQCLALSMVAACVAVIVLETLGLYTIAALAAPQRRLARLMIAWTATLGVLLTGVVVAQLAPESSRASLLLWYAGGAVALAAFRAGVATLARRGLRQGRLMRQAIIYGTGGAARTLLEALKADPYCDISVCAVFDDRADGRADQDIAGTRNLGNLDALMDYCRRTRVDMLIVSLPISAETRVLELLKKIAVLPVDIRLAGHASRLRLATRAYSFAGGVPLIDIVDRPMSDRDVFVKWLFDKVVGSLALIALAPLMGVIALAIRLDSRGPVLFCQKRYGFNNELIEVYKFRSMFVDRCDASASELVAKGDTRVTRIGRYIRKTSLDELPQLFNVMKGELSLVGPRPHALQAKAAGRLYHDAVDGYFARHKVKPGMTGWAQINGWRGETDTQEKIQKRVEHDLYYIDNWSVLFDLYVLFKTPSALITTNNAY